jgi:hypothetical protein
MTISGEQAVYRVHRIYRKGDMPKGYTSTLEIIDDNSRQVMAVCDLTGKASFTALTIIDHQQKTWHMRPNRTIMPSRWLITDPGQNIVIQFDQKILGKMVNPLYRIVLALNDGEGKEVHRLVDPRSSIPDRIMGVGPDDWAIISGEKTVARLVRLPRQTEPAKGIFGRLKNMMSSSDRGIISAGSSHALPAVVALGMLMLVNELTDTSGG